MTKRDAVKIELERIREANDGLLRATDIVAFARKNKKSALHEEFEWDNGKAAEKYRMQQARGIIRIHLTVLKAVPIKTRAYVSLAQDRQTAGGGYRAIEDALSDDEMRAQMLGDAIGHLSSWRRKYAALNELCQVFAAADEAIENHTDEKEKAG